MDDCPFDDAWSSLITRVDSASGSFIVFTQLKDGSIVVSVTDGANLWQFEMNADDIKSKASANELSSHEELLSLMKTAMENAEVQVSIFPQKLILIFGIKPGSISIDLYETTAQKKKDELKVFLFNLVDRVKNLEKKLEDVSTKLIHAEDSAKVHTQTTSPFKDQGIKKPKTRPKQTKGHSVINPGSKRKAAAKGVVFE